MISNNSFNSKLFTHNMRRLISSFVLSLIFSAFLVFGKSFEINKSIQWHVKSNYISFIMLSLLLTIILMLLFSFSAYFMQWLISLRWETYLAKIFTPKPSAYFIYLFFILICWIPAFLAMYPGNLSYDGVPQLIQLFINKQLHAHSPVLHTLFLTGSIELGNAIAGNYNAGMALHSILQAAIVAASFAYSIYSITKYRVPKVLALLSLLFFAGNPYFQIYVFTTTKDIIFGAILLVLFHFTIEIILDPNAFFSSKLLQIRYVIFTILMCLLRNQGIYMLVFMIPFLIYSNIKISEKGSWKKMLAICLLSLIAVKAFLGPISTALNIAEGDLREALCVPMVQMARVAHIAPEKISPEDKEKLNRLMSDEFIGLYEFYTADPVKNGFETDAFKEDVWGYTKLWIKLGVENPRTYIDAFCGLNYGYWYPKAEAPAGNSIMYDGVFLDAMPDYFDYHRSTKLPSYDEFLRTLSTGYHKSVFYLFNNAVPGWLILFFLALLIYRKQYYKLAPFILLFGYWGTLLLSPVTLSRYVFPITICIPAMLCFLSSTLKSEPTKC